MPTPVSTGWRCSIPVWCGRRPVKLVEESNHSVVPHTNGSRSKRGGYLQLCPAPVVVSARAGRDRPHPPKSNLPVNLPRVLLVAALSVVAGSSACDSGLVEVEYEIVAAFPHDPEAYTQGLLHFEGNLYESTGGYGTSTLRRVTPETGVVTQQIQLDSVYFGEGLARVGDELIQLTWKSGVAFVYDLASFELKRTHEYQGEGWGLCFDGQSLFMSDGSSTVTLRDPTTFEVTGTITIRGHDMPVHQINELECVGTHLYANVFQTDRILKIEKFTGEVVAELDGFALSVAGERPPDAAAVLNGLAYIESTGVMLATGKLWPKLLAIRINDG